MSLLQIGINLVLAILAFVFTSYLLGLIGFVGVANVLVSLLVAVGVFFANFAARITA